MRWRIEMMRQDHLRDVLKIEQASFLTPWTTRMFLEELSSPHSYCQVSTVEDEQNSSVCGYIVSWIFRSEVHILNLATHPHFRRNGIAQALIMSVIDVLYQRGGIWYQLEVRERNLPALRLYQKMGFAACGIRKRYYVDTGEDAVVMGLFYGGRLSSISNVPSPLHKG